MDDPFGNRTSVSGTMSLDGMPVKWGSLVLRGEKNEETQEQAMDSMPVRDGQFATVDGAAGTTPGANEAQVVIYAEEPIETEDGDFNPKVTGLWTGQVMVEEGQPVSIEITTADLTKPARE